MEREILSPTRKSIIIRSEFSFFILAESLQLDLQMTAYK